MSSNPSGSTGNEPARRLAGKAAVAVIVGLLWGLVFGVFCAASISFDPDVGDPSVLASSNPAAIAMFPVGQVAALIPISVIVGTGGLFGLAGSQLLAMIPIFLLAFPLGLFHVLTIVGLLYAVSKIRALVHRTRRARESK